MSAACMACARSDGESSAYASCARAVFEAMAGRGPSTWPTPFCNRTGATPPFVVVTDLDGTVLLRPPAGQPADTGTPPLSEGPAYAALVRLLEHGCIVVAATGSKLDSHRRLFWDALPLEHRRAGRVLMAVETARQLYRGSPVDGSPVEDEAFEAYSRAIAPPFAPAVVEQLCGAGCAGLKAFWADAEGARAAALTAADSPHAEFVRKYAGSADARAPLVTDDRAHYPRVEIRQSMVVFCGMPVAFSREYHRLPPQLDGVVDGRPAGRYCFDCVPVGWSKGLLVDYLTTQTHELVPGHAIALGDQPAGNDEGLTRRHLSGLPFVSVGEGSAAALPPAHLAACHVTRLSGAAASAAVLEVLADLLMEEEALELTTAAVAELVESVNAAERGSLRGT